MRVGDCEAMIVKTQKSNMTANPHEDEQGYVYMLHGDVYGIWLRNHTGSNTDVIVEIDGKEVGGWRLGSYLNAVIERPADDTGKFTFYEIGSNEAQKVGLNSIARNDLGLVKVTFIPEKVNFCRQDLPAIESYSGAKGGGAAKGGDWSEAFSSGSRGGCGQSMSTRSAGGTGLSGRSDQRFGTAGPIDRDYDRQVVINLRLVAKPSDEPRPLRRAATSNLVPPPIN